MRNSQIAEMFASGKEKGGTQRVFIEGNKIYSYGYHFVIAMRLDNDFYAFNNNGYSNSTSKHKNYVLSAISGSKILFIDNLKGSFNLEDTEVLGNQIKSNLKAIDEVYSKLNKSRAEHIKDSYKEQIRALNEQNKLILSLNSKVLVIEI